MLTGWGYRRNVEGQDLENFREVDCENGKLGAVRREIFDGDGDVVHAGFVELVQRRRSAMPSPPQFQHQRGTVEHRWAVL